RKRALLGFGGPYFGGRRRTPELREAAEHDHVREAVAELERGLRVRQPPARRTDIEVLGHALRLGFQRCAGVAEHGGPKPELKRSLGVLSLCREGPRAGAHCQAHCHNATNVSQSSTFSYW